MRVGASISAVGHGGVLFFALFQGFDSIAPPQTQFDAASIALISDAEFRALQPGGSESGETAELGMPVPADPPVGRAPLEPDLDERSDQNTPSDPEPVAAAASESPVQPEPPEETPLNADPEAADDWSADPAAPVDDREVVAVSDIETQPDVSARQSAPRISDEAALENRDTVEPDAAAPQDAPADPRPEDAEPAEPADAAISERTATETVTEADETEAKALQQTRPARRPPRPAANPVEPVRSSPAVHRPLDQETPAQPAEPDPTAAEDIDIAALIMQSVKERESAADRTGAPLTASEREGLKRAVQKCWNLASLSDEAKRVTVMIGVDLETDGRPVPGSIRFLNASTDGSGGAARKAFEAGQRAILRCLGAGYDLPREKYDTWRRVEFEFNPDEMRIR